MFPHSDICGSRLICSSPQLFAACHVLLRRLMPRHPPYALICFVFRDTSVSPCPCSNVSFLQDSFLANIVRSMSPYYSTLFALLVSLFVFVLCSCQCAIPRKKNISPVLTFLMPKPEVFFHTWPVYSVCLTLALPVHSLLTVPPFLRTAYVYYHTPYMSVNCFYPLF